MKWICVAAFLALAAPAAGQDTIALYFDDPVDGLQRFGHTWSGQVFEIVAVMKSESPGESMEFVMTELSVTHPGVFKLSTTKINNTPIDGGDNSLGEYALGFSMCVDPGVHEVVRVQYGDFSGLLGDDIILKCRGFEPGDTQESGFGGQPGYLDCEGGSHDLTLEPWFGLKECNFPDGSCALNMSTILSQWGCGSPTTEAGFSALKTRY